MNLKNFRKLSNTQQKQIINEIKHKYINELKNQEQISNELDVLQSAIRTIIEENNIKRTKEQIVAARKKYNLEHYGDENYCNSDKIKESLSKNNFNFGENSQLKIAKKLLNEKGIFSWIILSDKQKEMFSKQIKELVNNIKYDEEICEELKITNGCLKRFYNTYNIKRDSKLQHEIIKRRMIEKYGVENPFQLDKSKNKIKQQNLEKYGVEYSWQREDVKDKIKQTKLERYNDENYRNENKIKQTCLKLYNGESPFQSEMIKNKIKQTNLQKYGSISPFGNKLVIAKSKQTKLQKYGCEIYTNVEKGKLTKMKKYGSLQNIKKINSTCKEKYNVEWPCLLPQCINKSNSISKINQKFAELLKNYNINFEQEFVLENKKFDFKIGNTLLEINPTYTHNSTIGCGFNGHYEDPLSKEYHLNKTLLAQDHGFKCVHVWDWDDWNKIINLVCSKEKLYARKCEIKEISKQECDEFLNLYHLQNTCRNQTIKLGLYYNNKLVQVMTFGKPRYNKNYQWELLRLCTKSNYIIVGGSQKLWKHFLDTYTPSNIISYCDFSKFSGKVYETFGMELLYITNPNSHWSKGKEQITNNLLLQLGADKILGTNYGKGTSNIEIMIDNKYKEVYDCGQKVYEFKLLN